MSGLTLYMAMLCRIWKRYLVGIYNFTLNIGSVVF